MKQVLIGNAFYIFEYTYFILFMKITGQTITDQQRMFKLFLYKKRGL